MVFDARFLPRVDFILLNLHPPPRPPPKFGASAPPSTITITKSSSRWWFLRFDLEKNSEKNLSDKISAWRLAKFPCSYVHFFETKNYEILKKTKNQINATFFQFKNESNLTTKGIRCKQWRFSYDLKIQYKKPQTVLASTYITPAVIAP